MPRIKIHMSLFEEAMRKIKPLSAQELDINKKIAERFGRPSAPTRYSAATTYSNAVA